MTELLTNYGKIDLLFFDGVPYGLSVEEIRELQPGIILTRREGADYASLEVVLPTEKPEGWWEACYIWNFHSWGYQEPHGYRPLGWMLDLLARCRSWGGNLLVNAALKADGSMPDSYYERMKGLSDWMAYGKESVVGVEAGPYPDQCDAPVTIKANTWYIHLLPDEADTDGTSWYRHLLDPGEEAKTYLKSRKQAVITGVAEPVSVVLLRTEKKYHMPMRIIVWKSSFPKWTAPLAMTWLPFVGRCNHPLIPCKRGGLIHATLRKRH